MSTFEFSRSDITEARRLKSSSSSDWSVLSPFIRGDNNLNRKSACCTVFI